MKRLIFSLLCLLVLATAVVLAVPAKSASKSASEPSAPQTASAQQSKGIAILDRVSAVYAQSEGVEATFRIGILQTGGAVDEQLEGKAQLKGNKFRIEVPDEMICWFDGHNQWVYLPDVEEVNLSAPTEEELLMTNPVMVFQLYRYGYSASFAGERQYQGRTMECVDLTPNDRQSDVQRISIWFDKALSYPRHIRISNKDMSGSEIDITRYQADRRYADALFMFPPQQYPTAEVIDLR